MESADYLDALASVLLRYGHKRLTMNMMKLEEYFEKYCINITAFARKIGKSKTYIYRLLNGAVPKASDAKLIEEATEGKVTKEELLFPEEHQK